MRDKLMVLLAGAILGALCWSLAQPTFVARAKATSLVEPGKKYQPRTGSLYFTFEVDVVLDECWVT